MSVAALNATFGISNTLIFKEDPSGLIIADIENPLASAKLALQGAHLLVWRPRSSSIPVVWLSEDARLAAGKSPHSGAPVCWPWFGAHASNPAFPAHGFARNLPWEVVATSQGEDSATCMTLRLCDSDQARSQWPHEAKLELAIEIGTSLKLTLTTVNSGSEAIEISEAFHTYFQIGDIAQTRVFGLEGKVYADKIADFARSVQQAPIEFDGEVDRVYLDTEDECVIEDLALHRRIRVRKSGSRSTVVWTPGQAKGEKLGDLGPDGWRHMVCVESANTMDNTVSIPAGATHRLAVEYVAEPLA